MAEPDWEKLREIGAEIQALQAAGTWTDAEFDQMFKRGVEACNGQTSELEFIVQQSPSEITVESQ
jgi:hypothetical protein